MSIFGERLREARRRKLHPDGRPWKQLELAAAVGAGANTVNGWENGRAIPSVPAQQALAQVLGVSREWLLGESEEPDPQPVKPSGVLSKRGLERPLPLVADSYEVRVWQKQFELELTKAGATEDQVAEAMDLVRAPQVLTFFAGGGSKSFSEEKAIQGMTTMAIIVRDHLMKHYGLRFDQ
jgi:transcriptional regulator with XRE-family HTH domain